jgi:opacity protein-like surface antigen
MKMHLAAVALVAATMVPLVALAQAAPAPKPTNAIKNTQSGIKKAKSKQTTAQMKTKTGKNAVGAGGAHTDSEVPNNPGETSSKPGAGPGYGGGTPK